MKVESIVEGILQYFWPTLSDTFVISLENHFWSFWEWTFYTGFTVVLFRNHLVRQLFESREECKDQESIQSSAKPDPGQHMGKWQKHSKHNTQESQEGSPLPTGGHTALRNRPDTIRNTTMKHNLDNKKDPQKKHRLGTTTQKITGTLCKYTTHQAENLKATMYASRLVRRCFDVMWLLRRVIVARLHLSRDMWFPTMWHFDNWRLRRACAAPF